MAPVQSPLSLNSELTRALDLPFPPTSFSARAKLIEHLDAHILERLEQLAEREILPAPLRALEARARALRLRFEAQNKRVALRLAARIAGGQYSPQGLARALRRCADVREAETGYDALDELLAELIDGGALPELSAQLEPEMVAYQPTPGRVILALVERAALSSSDVLCDLGSGLGWVVIVSALLSGAQGIGVELEPAYAAYANTCAQQLGLSQLRFITADAREAPLRAANVFYLYTPFRGSLLEHMLRRLEQEARTRQIRVCSYGPCTPTVALSPWLRLQSPSEPDPNTLCVFESTH